MGNLRAQTDTLHWNAHRPVTWKDYKGSTMRLADNSTNVAATHSGIRLDMKGAGEDAWQLDVFTVFNRLLSCTKSDTSEYLLDHERNHFNLTELCARRLRKELSQTPMTLKNAKDKITTIYNKYIHQLSELQDQYDVETKHSLEKAAQAAWDAEIKKELKQLDDYASPRVIIRFKS